MKVYRQVTLVAMFIVVFLCLNHRAIANGDSDVTVDETEDCCEEIESLEERVQYLENKAVESDSKKIVLKGQLNRELLWLNNKVNSNLAHVDNDASSSRINITGTANFNDDITVGGIFEIEFRPNSSALNDVHDAQTSAESQRSIRIRKTELFFKHIDFGQLNLGRGAMASDGTVEDTDLSGTTVIALGATGPLDLAGGARFTNKETGDKFVDAQLSAVFNSGDGLGRKDRILYATPSYYGFSVQTSHGYQDSGDLFDLALKFSAKFFGTKVAAETSIAKDQTTDGAEFELINGSIGALFPISFSGKKDTGFNIFFATAHKDWDATGYKNGHMYMGKVGLLDKYFTFGTTAFAIDRGNYYNMALDPVVGVKYKGKSWGAFLVQKVDLVATELYAGYRNYKFERRNTGDRFNRIDAVVAGARVKL